MAEFLSWEVGQGVGGGTLGVWRALQGPLGRFAGSETGSPLGLQSMLASWGPLPLGSLAWMSQEPLIWTQKGSV